MKRKDLFVPPFYLKNTTLQTILASSKLRALGENRMCDVATRQILDVGNGIRLQGFYSKNKTSGKGLVVMIHGWEGSEKSAYMASTGRFLFNSGYDIFRLNLRDHGDSHDLNEGLFFGTLLEESYNGLKCIAEMIKDVPLYLLGFSMGANFAIRMALHCNNDPIENLKHIFCVNPPLDPMQATLRIDSIPLIKKYFIKKWKRSLIKNQNLYPSLYDFKEVFAADSCWKMTEILLSRYSDYPSPAAYFSDYTLTEGYLDRIRLPR